MRSFGPLSSLRRVLAFALMALMLLAGVERGVIGVMADTSSLAGSVGPICHASSGGAGPADPSSTESHPCCDECALTAAAVLPLAPQLSEPSRFALPIAHVEEASAAVGPSSRTPRQSQGPPFT
jgi:hypothetical protein